jgi:hypothetical protein
MASIPNATGEMIPITCESGIASRLDTITPNRAMDSNTPAVTARPSSRGVHRDPAFPVWRERKAMNPGYNGRTQGEVRGASTPAAKAIPQADTVSTALTHLQYQVPEILGGFYS